MKILLLSLLVVLSACGKSVMNRSQTPGPAIAPIFTGSGSHLMTFNNSFDSGSGISVYTDISLTQNLFVQLPQILTVNYFSHTDVSQLKLTVRDSSNNLVYNCLYNVNTHNQFERSNCGGVLEIDSGDKILVENIPTSGVVSAQISYQVR